MSNTSDYREIDFIILPEAMSQQKPCFEVPSRRRKRKRDNNNDDDDDGNSSSTPEDFDDVDALDAASYLSRVRAQARRLPEIFESSAKPTSTSDNTTDGTSSSLTKKAKRKHDEDEVIMGSAASLHFMLSSNNNSNNRATHGIQPPPSSQHVPAGGVQWVEQTLTSFSELRRYLEQCQSQGVGRDRSQRLPVPPMKDRTGWYTFCVGDDDAATAADTRADGYYDDDDSDNDNHPKEEEEDLPAWRKSLPPTGSSPTTSLLLQLDQVMVRRVLAHLTHYFCEQVRCDYKTQEKQQQKPQQPQQERLLSWLYALTARLERPIHRDDAVTLYALLKALAAARATMTTTTVTASSARPALATLNVLIAVVGIYLEQGGGYANVMTTK